MTEFDITIKIEHDAPTEDVAALATYLAREARSTSGCEVIEIDVRRWDDDDGGRFLQPIFVIEEER